MLMSAQTILTRFAFQNRGWTPGSMGGSMMEFVVLRLTAARQ